MLVINNFLTKQEIKDLSSLMFGMQVINEAKGDGNETNAENGGFLGQWMPNLSFNGNESETKRFAAMNNNTPALITNFNVMCKGGDPNNPTTFTVADGTECRFIRLNRAQGFFATESFSSNRVYSSNPMVAGVCVIPQVPQPLLRDMMTKVSKELGIEMNGCYVNLYPNGQTNINAHFDAEGGEYDIVSLSLGASRQFIVRHLEKTCENGILISAKKVGKPLVEITTQPGQLIVMQTKSVFDPATRRWLGVRNKLNFQGLYTHEIKKQPNCNEPRISLIFRQHNRPKTLVWSENRQMYLTPERMCT